MSCMMLNERIMETGSPEQCHNDIDQWRIHRGQGACPQISCKSPLPHL